MTADGVRFPEEQAAEAIDLKHPGDHERIAGWVGRFWRAA